MAEEKKEGMSGGTEALLFLAGLGALVALWWFTGGPSRADLRGMFLQPPAPVGTGNAYGPEFGATSTPGAAPAYDAGGEPYQDTNTYQY